jgi:glucose/arabinose dehydrogenase
MPTRMLLLVTLGLLAGLMPGLIDAKPAAADVPPGFVDRDVTFVEKPTALAFTPDGRMLITSKPGQLRVYKSGASGTTEALDISNEVCSNSERGLLGVTVDPDFGATGNNYVYLYYTFKKDGVCPDQQPARDDNPVNRVSRFVMSGDTLVRTSEEVLIDNIPSPNGNHNAGDLHFGNDGKLYASVGDGACDYHEPTQCQSNNDASRDRNILLGKILRVNPNGSIPVDNPYAQTGDLCGNPGSNGRTAPGNSCKETFAMGLRNPFRMAFDPDAAGTKFFINDVGGSAWEEVDRGNARADYGWNVCEGKHDNPYRAGSVDCSTRFTPPLYNYGHSTGCSSITGAAFVPDSAAWPGSYGKSYLFGDYVCGKIFKLTPEDRGGYNKTILANRLGQGGPVHMTFGPFGSGEALYYTTFANGGGQVRRISYVADNREPNAAASVTNDNYGPQDKVFQFSAQNSADPDGDTLTYEWDFTSNGVVDSTQPSPSHSYDSTGKETATLTVRDGNGGVNTAEVDVFPGDTAQPEPVIESPSPTDTFKVGQQITTQGSATDADEPGNPPSLQWEILKHHNGNHTHPLEEGTGSSLSFTAPAPEDLLATDPQDNYLEIRLTATDSRGLSKTVSRRLAPTTVDVRFETMPVGFKLKANGKTFVAPKTLLSWEGYKLNVNAPSQRHDGKRWEFRSWSDGRAAKHTIVTPGAQATYIATFRRR